MNRYIQTLIAVGFLLTSGLLFTLERLNSYVYWLGQTNENSYPSEPEMFYFQNWFVWIFLAAGLLILILTFLKEINRFLFR